MFYQPPTHSVPDEVVTPRRPKVSSVPDEVFWKDFLEGFETLKDQWVECEMNLHGLDGRRQEWGFFFEKCSQTL